MNQFASVTRRDQLVGVVVLLVAVAALALARAVLIPFLLAILLTFVLTPAVMGLQRRGLRRGHAVVLVMLLSILTIAGLVAGLSWELHGLAADLPKQKDTISNKVQDLLGRGPGVVDNLVRMVEEIGTELQTKPAAADRTIDVRVKGEKMSASSLFPTLAGSLVYLIASVSLVTALTATMLLNREDLRNRLINLIGGGHVTSTTRTFEEATRRISRYLTIQVAINAGFGLILGVGLALIGVPYSYLWGLLAAVIRFIPYLGTWLAGLLPLVLSFAADGWDQSLYVVGLIVFLGLATNYGLEPLLVSRSTGVSAIALVVSAAFWTWIWGPIGLILSTPITVCLCVLGKHVPALSFLNVLLGTDPAIDPQLGYYQRLLAHDEGEAAELLDEYLKSHTHEELFDQILLPTLIRAREDQERRLIDQDEMDFILRMTRDFLQTLEEPPDPATPGLAATPGPVFLGWATHGPSEELALEMLDQLLGPQAGRMDNIGSGAVSSEILQMVEKRQPALVFIATLAPGSLAQARFLCKRVRGRFPQLPLHVTCLGYGQEVEELRRTLLAAGANQVTTSLAEARHLLATLSHVVPAPAVAAAG